MYPSEKNSFNFMLQKTLYMIPQIIAHKTRRERSMMVVMTKDFSIEFLNETAGDFLKQVDGKKTIVEIASLLQKRYDIDEESLYHDLICLVRDLQLKRVIILN
jgi:hypothetical protein